MKDLIKYQLSQDNNLELRFFKIPSLTSKTEKALTRYGNKPTQTLQVVCKTIETCINCRASTRIHYANTDVYVRM